MCTLWTCLLLLACCGAEVAWASCNATYSVAVAVAGAGAQLLEDGRLLDVERNLTYDQGDFWLDGSDYVTCPCDRQPCIFKCCPLGHEMDYENETYCLPASNEPIPSALQLLPHDPCPGAGFLLPQAQFNVTQDGQLVYWGFFDEGQIFVHRFMFCVERKPDGDIVASVCPSDTNFGIDASGVSRLLVEPIFLVFSAMASLTLR